MTAIVPVSLGARSYHIHIGSGLLTRAGELILPLLGEEASNRAVPVVTDETVFTLHYPAFAAALKSANISALPIVLPPGEQTKSFSGLEQVVEQLLELGLERRGLVIAFGGGVIGDLAGFAAGIVKRGIDFVQVPTTLLAQVDSSVGGKTAIDTLHGKNLVGLFHQPRLVIADSDLLKTLPKRQILSGYAEVVKYGLLGDANFFDWLEENGARVLAGDKDVLAYAVAHSCTMKAEIVARDERESGERALLNLGHTFGHALEAASGYSERLTHGEGVALGCVLAFKLSERLGHCAHQDVARVEAHLASAGFPTMIDHVPGPRPSVEDLLGHMRHDKKARTGQPTFILAKGIGKAFISSAVPEQALRSLLEGS